MGEIRKIGKVGDLRLAWSKDKEQEIEAAKSLFDEKMRAGWAAFEDKGAGTKGNKVKEFNVNAERIILVPRLVAG